MSTVQIKLGITFEGTAPDFGSIEQREDGDLQLFTVDEDKLNTMLTKATCTGRNFSDVIKAGRRAIVLDAFSVYVYHAGADRWQEVI